MDATLRNIVAVARREFLWRIRNRAFLIGTAILVFFALVFALAPVFVRVLERDSTQDLGVHVSAPDLRVDPVAALDAVLNASTDPAGGRPKAFEIRRVDDLAAARADVLSGRLDAVLSVGRDAGASVTFTLYSKEGPASRTPLGIRQAATAIAVQDRLAAFGLSPEQQAAAFAPAPFELANADPLDPEPPTGFAEDVSNTVLNYGLVIFIFMAILLYGNWVATSVAEEKSSRVMELILAAATPFQMLGGKVLGVGAVALLQFSVMVVPALLALVFQGQIAALVLGEPPGTVSLPSGLTPPVLVAFGVFFVLGFSLYSVLYAAAGSLVSRQEDVNQVVAPMTLLSMVGYIVAANASLIDLGAGWVAVLSFIPFFSPYLMLSRVLSGDATGLEATIAAVILAVSVVLALLFAARVYRAGVLLYGQRPGIRKLLATIAER